MIRALSMISPDIPDWKNHPESVWVDVLAPTAAELQELQKVFSINPLALEDALTEGHWSRFEAYREHAFLVYRTLKPGVKCNEDTERLSLFWYPETDTLITLRLREVEYLNSVWQSFEPVVHGIEERVIYHLLSRGTDSFFDFTDTLKEETDVLEESLFQTQSSPQLVRQVFQYKHLIMSARRLVSSARESVAAFSRHAALMSQESQHHPEELSMYLRDVVDVLGRTYESLDSSREVLTSVLDVNLTLQSNRMNEVMKTLTTVSTIFLPLTFLAGVWGMNFEHMPELHLKHGYLLSWLAFLTLGLGLGWYFRRRGWW
ncbi:magnesium transporter CorA family protein [Deinococcus misasensis]|uniref:magnesium transporter CorA family protein n=1 Tax=Deinococcus misasensis TaxID=392413 RepID=UPI0005542876|nr:magnesium transporter CorA family protein [Deinococcus misasensis]